MKVVKALEEFLWITGNKPFRLFSIGYPDFDDMFQIDDVYESLQDLIYRDTINICVNTEKDREVLSGLFKKHGFELDCEKEETSKEETWFTLDSFSSDTENLYLRPNISLDSYCDFDVFLNDEKDIKKFIGFLEVLSKEYSYKTFYQIPDEEYIIKVIK